MATGMLEFASFKEIDHGGITIWTRHGFNTPVDYDSFITWSLRCCLYPNGFAFVTGNSL